MVDHTECTHPHRTRRWGRSVLTSIGHQEWLDRPSYRLENVLSFGYNAFGGARNRVTNALNGVWLGHPVHPPLASLASGVLTATMALDALAVGEAVTGRHTPGAHRLATYTLGVGIAANIGAAATGITDWQHTHKQDRRIGLVHGLLNMTATALYGFSWQSRRRGHRLRGAVLSTIGYTISLGSGYLGGHLVFASRIGTDMSGPRLATATWTAVLPEHLLPDGALCHVEAEGVGLVLGRDGHSVTAVGQYCPHLAAPMVDGWLDRGRIVCPWHGSQFDTSTGAVARGPASAPLPCYHTRINNGYIEVRAATTPPLTQTALVPDGPAASSGCPPKRDEHYESPGGRHDSATTSRSHNGYQHNERHAQ
ncbi:Rieske (2Fe-2S) domain-containing protein [Mycobacteroides abscessus subsp. abscessus]|uniref:Rieske 2Fe-2S domain-containing protein n=1 Tax=Mycobacteroides abscessus TaxID=36809 RepID=UPI00092B6142|nr:Rieske 2Fe-2S domain-containing protein [Mycobacteroides abscessus]SID79595.1 Rieske (2Fe-2S) domain-containing protein [Mycobacteroides abscessus subsp. abscessus]